MRRASVRWMGLAGVLGALACAGGEGAAQGRPADPAGYVGVTFVAADPVGELGTFFDQGFGGQFYGAIPLERSGHLRLRADLGFVIYGFERRRLCLSAPVGCRIEVDLTTTNSILFAGLGPELVLATGPVQPYVNASWGGSYFATTSSLGGSNHGADFASTTNFDDATFAWRAGAGLRLRVHGGRRPVALDVGVERHQNGFADFLTKGDIVDHPDGSITILPNRAEANLVTFRFGVTLGIPHGRSDGRGERRGR
jgi:hypothetical protein